MPAAPDYPSAPDLVAPKRALLSVSDKTGLVEAAKTLHEAGVEPDWVIGTSIGAINAAIIAGNAFEDRLDRLTEFWRRVEHGHVFDEALPAQIASFFRNFTTIVGGLPTFFAPNPGAFRSVYATLGAENAGYYSTQPLRETLSDLIDFDRINGAGMRLTVGASAVTSSEMRYFDSRDMPLCLDHVMASGALPPAFPAVRIDGELYAIEDAPELDKKLKHDIEVVVDRIAVRDGIQTRLADSFEQALKLAEGLAYIDLADGVVPGREEEAQAKGKNLKGAGLPPNRIVFSEKFACPVSGFTIESIEPRLFSFNAPQGACPACDGLGEKLLFDPQLVVPNEALSLKQGAVVPWAKSNPPSPYYMQVLSSLAAHFGFSLETPWEKLPGEVRLVILYGTGGKAVPLTFVDGKKSYTVTKAFEGVIGNLNRRMLQTESAWMREELSKYQTAMPCETCHGARLKPEALAVKIAGEDISVSTRRSVVDALAFFTAMPDALNEQQNQIARAMNSGAIPPLKSVDSAIEAYSDMRADVRRALGLADDQGDDL